MTIDESKQIEALLGEWYDWQSEYVPALGTPRVSPSCRGYFADNTEGQYDDHAVEVDRRLRRLMAERIDACVDALLFEHRAAIQAHFKAKRLQQLHRDCRAAVWSNPRAAFGKSHETYQAAKRRLLPIFRRLDLMTPQDGDDGPADPSGAAEFDSISRIVTKKHVIFSEIPD